MNKPPFVNLYDICGIIMLVLFMSIILATLGSKSITWGVVGVVTVLFGGAIFFAKKGAP